MFLEEAGRRNFDEGKGDTKRRDIGAACFEDEESDYKPRSTSSLQELEKTRKQILSSEPTRGRSPANTWTLAQ